MMLWRSAGFILIGILLASVAEATTKGVEVQVEFISRASIEEVSPAAVVGLGQDTVNSVALLSAADGFLTENIDSILAEHQVETRLAVRVDASQHIMIVIDGIQNANDYVLGGFQCKYGQAGRVSDCGAEVLSNISADNAILSVTAKLTPSEVPAVAANSSFDVTVLYQ